MTAAPLVGTGLVAVGTITPVHADGVIAESVEEQVELVWARLVGVLHQRATEPSRLVELSIQIAAQHDIGAVRSYVDSRLGDAEPAVIMTSGVVAPGVKVQLHAVATTSAVDAAPDAAAAIVENAQMMAVDPAVAPATEDAPAFVSRPVGSEVYHGFPVVDIPDRDGWRLGAVSGFGDGSREGDAFIVAPDGTRAGVVWSVGAPARSSEVRPADAERWGVYAVTVPQPMGARGELVENLAVIVDQLHHHWEAVREFPVV